MCDRCKAWARVIASLSVDKTHHLYTYPTGWRVVWDDGIERHVCPSCATDLSKWLTTSPNGQVIL